MFTRYWCSWDRKWGQKGAWVTDTYEKRWKDNENNKIQYKWRLSLVCTFHKYKLSKRKLRWAAGGINLCLCNILLRNLQSWHSCEYLTYYIWHILSVKEATALVHHKDLSHSSKMHWDNHENCSGIAKGTWRRASSLQANLIGLHLMCLKNVAGMRTSTTFLLFFI